MKDDEIVTRTKPPETADEWAYLWRGAHRANVSWPIVGPVHAFVTNWKAWMIGVLFLLWINRPEVLAAITLILGGE